MIQKSPAFQLYVNDFLGSAKVARMDGQQIGIYIMLLLLDWQEGGFQLQSVSLASWCRVSLEDFDEGWKIIGCCFKTRRGRMFNPRLELERKKQQEWREKSAKGGRTTQQGWLKGGSRVVQPQPGTPTPLPSPLPSPVTTTTKDTDSGESDLRASRLAALPKSVCDSLHSRWTKLFGGVDYGRFRKAILPIFSVPEAERPTPEEAGEAITAAWEFWIEQESREQGFFNLSKFVEQFGKWKVLGAMPLVDRRGDITERGNWAGSKSLRQQERDRRGR